MFSALEAVAEYGLEWLARGNRRLVNSGVGAMTLVAPAPIYSGEPGYRESMDGDGDGIACEPLRQVCSKSADLRTSHIFVLLRHSECQPPPTKSN